MKVKTFCKQDCEGVPYEVEVGNQTHLFCCEKGFKKSLKDFQESLKPKE